MPPLNSFTPAKGPMPLRFMNVEQLDLLLTQGLDMQARAFDFLK
jgi:hypothetical protein